MCVVGESGCDKTMTSNAVLRLLPRQAKITGGQIRYRRKADYRELYLATIDPESDTMRQIRGGDISMIF